MQLTGRTDATTELILVALLVVLIVIPRILQRYRVPGAITSLALGFIATQAGILTHSNVVRLLSTLGIVALFLFAGLEIEGRELRRNARTLIQHGAIWLLLLTLTAIGAAFTLHLPWRPAALFGLALVTPSTGFILSSLDHSGLSPDERFAVKTKAIAAELLALLALFVVMQSDSLRQLGLALLALGLIVVFIPLAFRFFAAVVLPYAPRSEFAFLLAVAVVTAVGTRALGVYYLMGAFLTGVAAQRFRARLPAMSSERIVTALEAFGSVFIPFYFFGAGAHIDSSQASWWALGYGVALLAVFVPVRVFVTALHRRFAARESGASSRRIATAMIPTLVFTLVLAELLRDRFAGPDFVVGALIVYTVLNTTLAGLLLPGTPSFEAVQAPESALPAPGRGNLESQPL